MTKFATAWFNPFTKELEISTTQTLSSFYDAKHAFEVMALVMEQPMASQVEWLFQAMERNCNFRNLQTQGVSIVTRRYNTTLPYSTSISVPATEYHSFHRLCKLEWSPNVIQLSIPVPDGTDQFPSDYTDVMTELVRVLVPAVIQTLEPAVIAAFYNWVAGDNPQLQVGKFTAERSSDFMYQLITITW